MQASLTFSQVPFCRAQASPARRASLQVVRCQAADGRSEQSKTGTLVMAAALAFSLNAPIADAKLPSAYENATSKSYEDELFAAIKARTGKTDVLPELTAAPKGPADAKTAKAPSLKFDGVPKVKSETPASVPAPEAPKPAEVEAPVVAAPAPVAATPAPAPAPARFAPAPASAPAAPAPAPVPAPVPSAGPPSDNKTVLGIGALAAIAVVAAAASGNNGQMETAGMPSPSASAPAATSASDLPDNVAEARAWIAAWKKKHGKA